METNTYIDSKPDISNHPYVVSFTIRYYYRRYYKRI